MTEAPEPDTAAGDMVRSLKEQRTHLVFQNSQAQIGPAEFTNSAT